MIDRPMVSGIVPGTVLYHCAVADTLGGALSKVQRLKCSVRARTLVSTARDRRLWVPSFSTFGETTLPWERVVS